jgi:lipid A 3-O-deacylase
MRAGIKGLGLAALLGLTLGATPVAASELTAGVYGHDLGPASREGGADLLVGWRSAPVEQLSLIWKPHVHAVVVANTSVPTHWVAVGFDWKLDLQRFGLPGGTYLRPGIGLAYTTGKAGLPPVNAPGLAPAEIQRRLYLYHTRKDFGSHWEFEPDLALGYQLSPKLAAELSYEHLSNGEILHHGKNQGLDDLGLRLVYAY